MRWFARPSTVIAIGLGLVGAGSSACRDRVAPESEPRPEVSPAEVPPVEVPPAETPSEDAGRDVLSTALTLDVQTLRGRAVVTLAGTSSGVVSLDVGDLEISAVGADGEPLGHEIRDGRLDVRVPGSGSGSGSGQTVTLVIDYAFERKAELAGYVGDHGATFLWPNACGNLFPCSAKPDDGTTFELELRGVPEGLRAIHPTSISTPAPPYMLAFAVGDYEHRALGTTAAGTKVGVDYVSGSEDAALAGTEHLAAAFDWLERTYGPYAFGDEVASVEVTWPVGGYAGMEHHPYWHVETGSMDDPRTHVHEAAHGWFGNGVRIRCWEDLVLSEGVTSYLTERALEAVGGPSAWSRVEASHEASTAYEHEEAWPAGCTRAEPVLSSVVYVDGALFMRAVEQQVGRPKLDAALADFYRRRVGTAATMRELVEAIEHGTEQDLGPLVEAWLR